MKRLTFAIISTMLMTLGATAQPVADTTNNAAAVRSDKAPSGNAADGMKMGKTATLKIRFAQFSAADVMASKLEDAHVYNNQNEEVGEIEDFVIKDGKTISGVVVSVGGFLGLGEHYVLIEPSSIVLSKESGEMRAYVDTSKDELQNAPNFKYEKR